MAGALAKRMQPKAAPRFARRGPSPKIVKLESRVASLTKRAREVSSGHEGVVVAIGTGVALGMLQKRGTKLPTIAGIDPNVLYGAGLYFLGPKLGGAKLGKAAREAGKAMLAVAGKDTAVRGSVRVGEDDEDSDVPDVLLSD